MTPTCTRILGNLDCEYHWAMRAARGTERRPRPLSTPVLQRISLLATLLRVLAEEGDELWTPAPVDPACLRPVPGLPEVRLLSGPEAGFASNQRVIGWADAPPWPLPDQRLDAAMRVNDRGFVLQGGWGLPEAVQVDSLEAFDRARPCDAPWVAKAPHSAAGRDRVVAAVDDVSGRTRAAVARLLRTQGRVVMEPWRERTLDFGVCGDARADAEDLITYHEQEIGARGRFQGIVIPAPSRQAEGLTEGMRQKTLLVRNALLAAGYEGPFGIDGWHYKSGDGPHRINFVGEVNARLTFGRIASALATRVAYPAWGKKHAIALRFGALESSGPDDRHMPLLGSADGRKTTAWLERVRRDTPTAGLTPASA